MAQTCMLFRSRSITIASRSCLALLMLSTTGVAQSVEEGSTDSVASADDVSNEKEPTNKRKIRFDRAPDAGTSTPSSNENDQGTGPQTSLDELLAYADDHAPSLGTARAQVGIAKANIAAAQPFFPSNPIVGGSIGSRNSAGQSGLEYQVNLSQQIEIAGEPFLRRKAARAETKAATFVEAEVRWQIHVTVHRLHNELLLMRARREQAERFVQFSETLRRIAKGQVDAGEASPLTLLVADADLAQTRSELIDIAQREASTRTQLSSTIGWPQETRLRVVGTLPEVSHAQKTTMLLGKMAESHPSLKARKEAVTARKARLKAQRRSAWPKPTIGGSYAREAGLGGQAAADIWLFNLSLPIPLWRRNPGGVAKAAAEVQLAQSRERQVTTVLERNLERTANSMNAAADRVKLYEQSVIPQLEKNLKSLERAYELGEVNLLQVSQTRQRLLDSSRQYLDARISYFRAAAALEGFVGADLVLSNGKTL